MSNRPETSIFDSDLIQRLLFGVPRCGETEAGDELFDIDAAETTMAEAAEVIRRLIELATGGWSLVPIVPTPKMHRAAWLACDNGIPKGRDWAAFNAKLWAAMIEVAPKP